MSDMDLLTSMAFGKAHQLDRDNRNLNNAIDEGQVIINRLYAETQRLAAELKQERIIGTAVNAANNAERAAWRNEHRTSHMHDVMGNFKNGNVMRRNFVIWADVFDATCRSQGIGNPGALRIS